MCVCVCVCVCVRACVRACVRVCVAMHVHVQVYRGDTHSKFVLHDQKYTRYPLAADKTLSALAQYALQPSLTEMSFSLQKLFQNFCYTVFCKSSQGQAKLIYILSSPPT